MVTKDPRGQLTAELKKFVSEYDALTSRAHTIKAKIFGLTYRWVNAAVKHGDAPNVFHGCVRLGGTLRKSVPCIESWYYCGAFMAQQGINPTTADARSVRGVYNKRKSITRAEQLRCIDLIKKRRPYPEVKKILDRSKGAIIATAERRATRLQTKGQLNKTRAKLELLAFLTLLRRVFKTNIEITVTGEDGEVLLSAGHEPATDTNAA